MEAIEIKTKLCMESVNELIDKQAFLINNTIYNLVTLQYNVNSGEAKIEGKRKLIFDNFAGNKIV